MAWQGTEDGIHDRAGPGLYIEPCIWHVRIYGVYVYVLRMGCMMEQEQGLMMTHVYGMYIWYIWDACICTENGTFDRAGPAMAL